MGMDEQIKTELELTTLARILEERKRQNAQWGGHSHDDSHERFSWCRFIQKQNWKADDATLNAKPQEFEERMIKIAALAIAALESSRRKRPV